MIISTHGSKHFLGGLPRIEISLIEAGHEINDSNPDFIYSNDAGGFDSAIAMWHNYGEKPKLILNILDIPWHCKEINEILDRFSKVLPLADKVTTISHTVRRQILQQFNIESSVVYYPARSVFPLENVDKKYDFFINGRVSDPNKRAYLACQVSNFYKDKSLVSCGSEYLKCAANAGVVSDDSLNKLYNYSRITFAFGKVEGVGMQVIESLMVGTPVITLSDNETNFEFCPPEMISDPNKEAIIDKINVILDNYEHHSNIASRYGTFYKELFSAQQVANNILKVYESLI